MFKKILLVAVTVMMCMGAVQAGGNATFCGNSNQCNTGSGKA